MKTISIYKEQSEQTMTSLEIAELTGKNHKDVLKAIRNMEPAWEKVCGRNFALTSRAIIQPNGGTREVPCYQLTKTECLYIATKFNDEARAKLVLRWEELERAYRGQALFSFILYLVPPKIRHLEFNSCCYPASWLFNIAIIYVAMVCQIISFQIDGVTCLVPRQSGVNDGVGVIGAHLTIDGSVCPHAVLPTIVQRQLEGLP